MGKNTNADRVVVGKQEEMRPLGRPTNICSIETDLKGRMGWCGMDFSGSG